MSEILQIEVEYFLLCISTLITLVNPLGIAPIFVIMTERFDHESRKSIAKNGIITAGITLIIFAGLGSLIFKLYSITIEAFQIMGGILFFRSGFRMSEVKIGRSRITPMEREESQESDDLAISPIGIPLIAGPGAITASMLLSSQTPQFYSYATLGVSIFLVLAVVYLILRNGGLLMKALGYTGMRVIQRLMGLVLMVIAVQFVINGVMSILSPLFSPSL